MDLLFTSSSRRLIPRRLFNASLVRKHARTHITNGRQQLHSSYIRDINLSW